MRYYRLFALYADSKQKAMNLYKIIIPDIMVPKILFIVESCHNSTESMEFHTNSFSAPLLIIINPFMTDLKYIEKHIDIKKCMVIIGIGDLVVEVIG